MKQLILIFSLLPFLVYAQQFKNVRFDTSATTSEAVTIYDGDRYYLGALLLPQSFADSLSFQVSRDGTNWYTMHDPDADSSEVYYVEVDSSAARCVVLDKDVFSLFRRLKVITDVTTSAAWDTVQAVLGLK